MTSNSVKSQTKNKTSWNLFQNVVWWCLSDIIWNAKITSKIWLKDEYRFTVCIDDDADTITVAHTEEWLTSANGMGGKDGRKENSRKTKNEVTWLVDSENPKQNIRRSKKLALDRRRWRTCHPWTCLRTENSRRRNVINDFLQWNFQDRRRI